MFKKSSKVVIILSSLMLMLLLFSISAGAAGNIQGVVQDIQLRVPDAVAN